MKEAWTYTAQMWYDEQSNLLVIRMTANARLEVIDIKNHYDIVERLLNGNKPFVLSDIRASFSMTREARRIAALQSSNQAAIAVVTNQIATKLFMNFFFSFYNHACPTKLFNSEEEAMKWLRKHGLRDGK